MTCQIRAVLGFLGAIVSGNSSAVPAGLLLPGWFRRTIGRVVLAGAGGRASFRAFCPKRGAFPRFGRTAHLAKVLLESIAKFVSGFLAWIRVDEGELVTMRTRPDEYLAKKERALSLAARRARCGVETHYSEVLKQAQALSGFSTYKVRCFYVP